ncbi:MAG: bifunctional UDP-N-acetylglucosamine diphosphorylase/glucosamine-1-phosphate N-acetyltransferase GlmU [Spirochaetes bacterium]|nr:bifunctional UDP-N-acetylglucosamine diphosphorylase/glucosamine-1-phosphate N-acetyltransferase GlmU [Spirochaetota bacterium]
MDKVSAIILAAGLGTRMKSKKPKILHQVAGKSMINCIIDQLKKFKLDKIVIVVGSKESIPHHHDHKIHYVLQKEKMGTAHAVMQAESHFKNYKGDVLILNGDVPLITYETLNNILQEHRGTFAVLSLLTAKVDDPTGYGRIIRKKGEIFKIIEELDADDYIKEIKEINAGTYCFKGDYLYSTLNKVKKNPVKKEYYITDSIEILNKQGAKIHTILVKENNEILGVNRRHELAMANMIMQNRIHKKLMDDGVTILDIDSTYIEYDVKVGQDTIIYPFTFLYGKATLGENCQIGPFVQITESKIGNNARIFQSTITGSMIKDNVQVGPYAHIRNNSVLLNNSGVGNFVEVTRSVIGENTKAYHLSYIGDTKVGQDVNFGAGVVTVNYDGEKKNKTIIGDKSFIGSSTTIIAPAKIENKENVPAGTVVTKGKNRKK